MSNLSADPSERYTEKLEGYYQRAFYGEKNVSGTNLQTCKTDCDLDERCNSVGEEVNRSDGKYRCWLGGETKSMEGTSAFIAAQNHNVYFKNKTEMTSKDISVKYTVQDGGPYADASEVSRTQTDGSIGDARCYPRQTDTGYFCDRSGGTSNTEDGFCKSNAYFGATGNWHSIDAALPFRNTYGCPRIGVITGGKDFDPQTCGSTTANYSVVDDNGKSKAKCSYNKIYHTNNNVSSVANAIKPTFSELQNYFEGSDLKKAQESWCRSGEVDVLLNDSDCQGISVFKYRSAIADMLPDDWYARDTDCDRFRRLGILMTATGPDQTDKTKFINKMKKLPTNGTAWTTGAIRAMNQIMLNDSVIDQIKGEITTHTAAYCNARSNRGKDDPVCGCKNAIDGWAARDSGGCSKGEKGCDDVKQYIDIRKKLKEINSAGSAFLQINDNFDPNRDSQACIDGHADNGSSVLAYQKKNPSGPKIIQLCEAIVQSLDQSTLSIKGDLNIVCNQSAEAVTNSQTGNVSGGGGTDGGGTDGGEETDGKKVNIWIWILIAICSFLIVIGVGGALLFLL
jgi:hypothetical protein